MLRRWESLEILALSLHHFVTPVRLPRWDLICSARVDDTNPVLKDCLDSVIKEGSRTLKQ
jgi:hypothetical protein